MFTVCDRAAGETAPRWPGLPVTAHWSFDDPAARAAEGEEPRAVFDRVCREIESRLRIFLSLPPVTLDRMILQEVRT